VRLQLILPRVEPATIEMPSVGKHFRHHQEVANPLKDTRYDSVTVHRYACLRCHRTFRLYPQGVTRAQTSQRVKGLAVMLYLLGLSYGATSLALEALGVYLCKSSIYEAVQAAAEKVPGMKRHEVFHGLRTPALGGDLTSVKYHGEWLQLDLAVDDLTGLVLTVEELPAEDAATIKEWLQPVAAAVGAKLLVTDDADALKAVADEVELEHQVCKSHVKRNTKVLVDTLASLARGDRDGSLADIGASPEQALTDLKRLEALVRSRRPQDEDELGEIHRRYIEATPPSDGEKASVAYRLRLLFLDRWNLWRRLTRYGLWQGPQGETVDGTNNGCERAIGWWVKELYRTMRG
jgi:transposase-like protein